VKPSTSREAFSRRHRIAPADVPIMIRDEAPHWLRDFIVTEALSSGMSVSQLRDTLCSRLLESPNPDNWSDRNKERETRDLLNNADWFLVYDCIEDIAVWLHRYSQQFDTFSLKLNEALMRKGVGWQLINTSVETRGEEVFEAAVRTAIDLASKTVKPVAAKELHEALHDLSRRPEADLTGAIQHAMAALECVARDVTGDVNATLGALLKKHPGILPPALDDALSKIWGFASDRARHLRENQPPAIEEANLIVGLAGTLATYLLMKLSTNRPTRR